MSDNEKIKANQQPDPEAVEVTEPTPPADEAAEVAAESNSSSEAIEPEIVEAEGTDASALGDMPGTDEPSASALAAVISEYDNRYKRLQADFDNYRRRTVQEKEQIASFVKAELIKDFLPMLDNFERAVAGNSSPANQAFMDGFIMIHQGLMAMLSKNGVAVIDAKGKPFDPNFHQAVMRAPSDEYPDDTVSEVLQTGYTVDGKTLRPAMVKVVSNT